MEYCKRIVIIEKSVYFFLYKAMDDRFLKKIMIILLLIMGSPSLFSQHFYWFSYQKSDAPFLAEMYSPATKIEMVKSNSLHPLYYKNNDLKRPLTELQLGFQLPIFMFEKKWDAGTLNIALATPFSALTLIDFFEPTTSPVINTDYRFGTKVEFVFSPQDSTRRFFKNYYLTLVPIFHESTHIGDELALHGYTQNPNFYRINLSYEAWQLFIGFNRPYDKLKGNLSFDIGYQRLMPYKSGYYNIDSIETRGQNILFSKKRDVWIARAEYRYAFLFKNRRLNEAVASAEVRYDTKLGYTPENPEKQTWSVNFIVGYRMAIKNSNRYIGIYYRHYHGIVPYGQFRDKKGYVLNGIGIIFY